MGDGGAEGLSAVGDGGQAAISLMPYVDGIHVCIFESLQLEEGTYCTLWEKTEKVPHQVMTRVKENSSR